MMKLVVCVVLLHIWAVCGQHGSFLSTSKDPLCVKQGNYVINKLDSVYEMNKNIYFGINIFKLKVQRLARAIKI